MVGKRRAMMMIGRILQALSAASIVLALAPVAAALAAPPSIEIQSPHSGSTVKTDAPTVEGVTSDSSDPLALDIYTAAEPLIPVQALSANLSAGTWRAQVAPLADGAYIAKAEQVSEGEPAIPAETSFTVETIPDVTLEAVNSPTNDTTPTFHGALGSMPGDLAEVTVDVHLGNVNGPVVASGPATVSAGTWSYTASQALPSEGEPTYVVQASQRDEAGHEGVSNTASFVLDTTPPTPVIATPKAGETLKTSRPVFSGSTSKGDILPVAIEIYSAETSTPQILEVKHSGTSWTTGSSGPALANGAYVVRARQSDAAGNVGESPAVAFTVESPSPTVTLDKLSSFTNDNTPRFAGSADTSEAQPSVTLRVWRGTSASGALAQAPLTVVESGGAWAAGLSKGLSDGTYTAQAEQPAEAPGDSPGFSDVSIFTIDTVAPTPTLVVPTESTGIETVSGTAGDEPGDDRQIVVELFSGAVVEAGQALETITVNRTEGTWSATFAGLASGGYTAIARQSDEAGNSGESSPGTFVVVVPASAAPATPSAPSMLTNTIVVSPPASPSSLVLMQPFPIVRIAGAETSYGAKIRLLTVQAPLGSKITVTCKGSGCKTKSESRVATAASKGKSGTLMLSFPRFERALRVGAVLQIRVSKAGEIGKYTSFTIRRHKLPVRTDACLNPAGPAPIACPAS
jgi:hypothetical protein